MNANAGMRESSGMSESIGIGATVGLLRHGDTGFSGFRGRLDDALTALGERQMRDALDGQGQWSCVISSPLQRCAVFARCWAAEQGVDCVLEPAFRELDFGDWEGRSAAELMEAGQGDALAAFWANPRCSVPPGGEGFAAFEQRVLMAWQQLHDRHAGKRVLLVSHGGVLRLLLCHWHGLPESELLQLAVPHAAFHRLQGERSVIA